jgi:hypothetical protein
MTDHFKLARCGVEDAATIAEDMDPVLLDSVAEQHPVRINRGHHHRRSGAGHDGQTDRETSRKSSCVTRHGRERQVRFRVEPRDVPAEAAERKRRGLIPFAGKGG